MKKQKPQIAFIIVLALYFLLNGLIPRNEKINETSLLNTCYSEQSFDSWQHYQDFLVEEGYSFEAAAKIAKVENGILPIDEEYTSYMED